MKKISLTKSKTFVTDAKNNLMPMKMIKMNFILMKTIKINLILMKIINMNLNHTTNSEIIVITLENLEELLIVFVI